MGLTSTMSLISGLYISFSSAQSIPSLLSLLSRGTSTAFRFSMGLIGPPLTCLFSICMSMVFAEISFLRKKRISAKTNG
ncbi:hypothetical protein K438DRAFT_1854533, partial [Mycena galopus ATCC 62051]